MTNEIYKFAIVLAFAFIIPIIGYLIGLMWSNSVAKVFGVPPNPKLRKLAATFFLGLPIFVLATYVRLDFGGLRDSWLQSPVLLTAVALLFLVLVPALLIRAIIKLLYVLPPGHRHVLFSADFFELSQRPRGAEVVERAVGLLEQLQHARGLSVAPLGQ